MRYRLRASIGIAVAAVALVAPTTPANASITGAVGFVCEAHLSVFPTPSGGGSCEAGLVPGAALGVGAGVDSQGHAYVVAGLGTFSASFSYNETCPPPPVPALPIVPLIGTANGTATISGLTAVHSDPAPTVVGATITTNFTWIRVGLTAVIVTFNTRVDFSNGHFAVSASPVSGIVDDAAAAAFAPLPPPLGPGLGNCLSPVATHAAVVGADVMPV